jgi:ferritin-like metal-binding protein YciE
MALLDAKIESPEELFVYQLGAALTMEETILELLEKLQQETNDPSLRRQLQQHYKETQGQVDNLHRVFEALGEPVDRRPCPAIEGLEREGEMMLKEVDESLNDAVILQGVLETEHHEIAVYDGLIIMAEQLGDDDVIALLNENVEQEAATLEKAIKATEQLAKRVVKQTA